MSSKILIVDDQDVMLQLLFRALSLEGFTVIAAKTGKEALEKVRRESPDLVILDILLPDISGTVVCSQVREVLGLTDLPIILLSGRTELEAKIEGLEAGADDYVTKPVNTKELVVRMKTLLARAQRLRKSSGDTRPAVRPPSGVPIAVIGAKGGVGTTTLVANLGAALAQRGNSVVAVELRPFFGSLARQFGAAPHVTLNALLGTPPTSINEGQVRACLVPAMKGLQLLVGPQKVMEYQEIQEEQAKAIIETVIGMAVFVLMDLPHMPSMASRAALRLAQVVILVIGPDVSCMDAAKAWVDLMSAWDVPESAIKLVVINRSQAVESMSALEIERVLGLELLGTVVAAPDLAATALKQNRPMIVHAQTSLVSTIVLAIADKIATYRSVSH